MEFITFLGIPQIGEQGYNWRGGGIVEEEGVSFGGYRAGALKDFDQVALVLLKEGAELRLWKSKLEFVVWVFPERWVWGGQEGEDGVGGRGVEGVNPDGRSRRGEDWGSGRDFNGGQGSGRRWWWRLWELIGIQVLTDIKAHANNIAFHLAVVFGGLRQRYPDGVLAEKAWKNWSQWRQIWSPGGQRSLCSGVTQTAATRRTGLGAKATKRALNVGRARHNGRIIKDKGGGEFVVRMVGVAEERGVIAGENSSCRSQHGIRRNLRQTKVKKGKYLQDFLLAEQGWRECGQGGFSFGGLSGHQKRIADEGCSGGRCRGKPDRQSARGLGGCAAGGPEERGGRKGSQIRVVLQRMGIGRERGGGAELWVARGVFVSIHPLYKISKEEKKDRGVKLQNDQKAELFWGCMKPKSTQHTLEKDSQLPSELVFLSTAHCSLVPRLYLPLRKGPVSPHRLRQTGTRRNGS
ncbi:hypothetical protein VP01_3117g1 [Puccinia sorghi]|uniref:Uncharacterized protein n=1 Tax=Puccinia sorghi TaxID=27349 RepID=A0A0L6UZG7_9BASI|nr:hypothetical protein VP01_3117g1 [Puccinia sorghi]